MCEISRLRFFDFSLLRGLHQKEKKTYAGYTFFQMQVIGKKKKNTRVTAGTGIHPPPSFFPRRRTELNNLEPEKQPWCNGIRHGWGGKRSSTGHKAPTVRSSVLIMLFYMYIQWA